MGSFSTPECGLVGLHEALNCACQSGGWSRPDTPGQYAFFNASICPAGWVAANGTVDLRGEFIRGWDSGRGVDLGRTLASWQPATAIRYLIDNYSGYAYGTFAIGMRNVDGYIGGAGSETNTTGADFYFFTAPGSIQSGAGDNNSALTRSRNISLLGCMKL